MYKLKEIADKVYYVGVNDRQKALFENMWPLPYGVSYNSYLIVDEKTVLVDTVDVCYSDIFLKKIADALDGRPLDFLIVNHMEPDHAGSIRLLRQQYPDVQIVGNKQTFGMLCRISCTVLRPIPAAVCSRCSAISTRMVPVGHSCAFIREPGKSGLIWNAARLAPWHRQSKVKCRDGFRKV